LDQLFRSDFAAEQPIRCTDKKPIKNMKLMTKAKTKKTPASTQAAVGPSRPTTAVEATSTPMSGMGRQITTECIASRAYTLWEQAGRPQGRDLDLWLQAESQLKQSSQAFSA
jgi:hypothetical protein